MITTQLNYTHAQFAPCRALNVSLDTQCSLYSNYTIHIPSRPAEPSMKLDVAAHYSIFLCTSDMILR